LFRVSPFLVSGGHQGIIQTAEKLAQHSHSWLCASDTCNRLSNTLSIERISLSKISYVREASKRNTWNPCR
jgi:hypothetical protein